MVHIFAISDKILIGKQINEISAYFAETLFKYNFKILEHKVFGFNDNFNDIFKEQKPNDIYILLVEKGNKNLNDELCNISSCEIVENISIKNNIYDYYRKRNCPLEKECENEWLIPQKARAIINPNNITQGYILEHKDILYCVMPIDFKDATKMFNDVVLDYLLEKQKKKYKNYTFKTFGLSTNNLTEVLTDVIKNKERVSINFFEKNYCVDIVVKAQTDNIYLDEIAKKVFLKLNNYIYSVEDIPIGTVAYDLVKLNDLKISFAETITGGKTAYLFLSQADDAKKYVEESVIVNSKGSKQRVLNIDDDSFVDGDVSVKVVYKMALNMLKQSNSDIVVASVGESSKDSKSPGLSYIAVGDKKEIHIYRNMFVGGHKDVIDNIVTASYFYLIKKLKKNDFHFEKTTV